MIARPTFSTFVGQAAVKARLAAAIASARRRGESLDHVLLTGSAGLGKTSLARAIAAELGARVRVVQATAIRHVGELCSLLCALAPGDVLFLDEVHALPAAVAEALYSAMEDRRVDVGERGRAISIDLPAFTLVAATTEPARLSRPLVDRFGIQLELRPYSSTELAELLVAACPALGVVATQDAIAAIAERSRGTPRVALRMLRRCRDVADHVDASVVARADLGVDARGLSDLDRAYLAACADRPVGIEALCSVLGRPRAELAEVEGALARAGLVERTPRGRFATDAGRRQSRRRRRRRRSRTRRPGPG